VDKSYVIADNFHKPFILCDCKHFVVVLCYGCSKTGYGCKWTWRTIQFYTMTQIELKEQHF